MTDDHTLPARWFTWSIEIAAAAHRGQLDKAGMPYILHPLRVGLAGKSDAEMMVGFLHDVVEDSDWTLDGLRDRGFPEYVVAAVDALTKRDGEPYEAYLLRVKANPLACAVKLNDLADNLREDRAAALSDSMIRRYTKAQEFLQEVGS